MLGVTLVVFFTWTFPVNQATSNWTIAPHDWETLRAKGVFACRERSAQLPRVVRERDVVHGLAEQGGALTRQRNGRWLHWSTEGPVAGCPDTATLVRVQQQTARLREAMWAMQSAAAADARP